MYISLKNINASAYQYQLSVQDKFKDICHPLFKLGIKYFIHLKIFQNGKYLIFSNHKDYLKACLEITEMAGDIFFQYINSTKKNESHSLLLPSNPYIFDKKKEPVIHMAYHFNIWNMFAIYKGNGMDFIQVYVFAGDRNDVLLHNIYINNIVLLEGFCNYFDEQAEDILDCKDESRLAYLGRQFSFYNTSQENFLIPNINIKEFLIETRINKVILKIEGKNIPLTRREIECLKYISLGKTSKEIARTLKLSPRTVEFYFQNIKQKSGLKRGELLTFLFNSKKYF